MLLKSRQCSRSLKRHRVQLKSRFLASSFVTSLPKADFQVRNGGSCHSYRDPLTVKATGKHARVSIFRQQRHGKADSACVTSWWRSATAGHLYFLAVSTKMTLSDRYKQRLSAWRKTMLLVNITSSCLLQRRREVGPAYINQVCRPEVLGQGRQVYGQGVLQALRPSPQQLSSTVPAYETAILVSARGRCCYCRCRPKLFRVCNGLRGRCRRRRCCCKVDELSLQPPVHALPFRGWVLFQVKRRIAIMFLPD